jgi:hypothetical protein
LLVGAVLHRNQNGGSVNVKRIVGLLVIALVVYFIIARPDTAANSVESILGTLRGAAESITSFFARLV